MSTTNTIIAKVSSKGQVTIPAVARRKYGLRIGQRIQFDMTGARLSVVPEKTNQQIRDLLKSQPTPNKLSDRETALSERATKAYRRKLTKS